MTFTVVFKGKRRHRCPRWSSNRSKRRKLNEVGEVDRGKKKGEESESEESYKSEEISSEDACSHCGLPNHPELVSASVGNCVGLFHYFHS